jgi:ketosteroid isomerase-like protein
MMNSHRAVTIATVAALVLIAGSASSLAAQGGDMTRPETGTSAEAEVLEVIEAFNTAFARNDPATYFSFIDDDITVLTPSNPYRVEGLRDDREEFEYGLANGRGRVGYFQELQPHVQRYGDVAVVTYFSRGSYGPGGAEQVLYLKETDVLVKRPTGWKIVHIHVSSTPGS